LVLVVDDVLDGVAQVLLDVLGAVDQVVHEVLGVVDDVLDEAGQGVLPAGHGVSSVVGVLCGGRRLIYAVRKARFTYRVIACQDLASRRFQAPLRCADPEGVQWRSSASARPRSRPGRRRAWTSPSTPPGGATGR